MTNNFRHSKHKNPRFQVKMEAAGRTITLTIEATDEWLGKEINDAILIVKDHLVYGSSLFPYTKVRKEEAPKPAIKKDGPATLAAKQG